MRTTCFFSDLFMGFRPDALSLRLSSVVIALVMLGSFALGDGKVLSIATAKVTIPDQTALLSYHNGTEFLAIETDFQGEGDDFAWIMPLPSTPEVREISKGFFPTLRVLFKPGVKHQIDAIYINILIYGSILGLFIFVVYETWKEADSRAHFLSYLFLVSLIFLFFLTLLAFLVPTVGGRSHSIPSTISIHQQEIIGSYEVVSLSTDNAQDLVNWLKQNSYKVSGDDSRVLEEYVKKGWGFTTVRLRVKSDGKKRHTPHPLAFVFKTDKPVYPLKLTGVDNGRCHIDLYVFGPERAEADGFEVLQCKKPIYPPLVENRTITEEDLGRIYPDGPLLISHREVRSAVEDCPVVTKLSQTFRPGEMTRDAYIHWKPFEKKDEVYYSHSYALTYTLNACTIGWVVLITLSYLSSVIIRKKRPELKTAPEKKYFAATVLGTLLITALTGAIIYSLFPKREVRLQRRHHYDMTLNYYNAIYDLKEDRKDPRTVSIEEVKQAVVTQFKDDDIKNRSTGEDIKEENSPGNYMIRKREGRWEFICFDRNGAEFILWQEP